MALLDVAVVPHSVVVPLILEQHAEHEVVVAPLRLLVVVAVPQAQASVLASVLAQAQGSVLAQALASMPAQAQASVLTSMLALVSAQTHRRRCRRWCWRRCWRRYWCSRRR